MVISIILLILCVFSGIAIAKAGKLRHIHIQKEVVIEGTIEEVFNQVVYLKNFPQWSPFLEADPTQQVKVTGTDGIVGAQYHWVGNKGKDIGYQEVKEINPGEYVRMECDIQKPFTAQPVFEYRFIPMGDRVKVVQDFNLKSSRIDAFFMWVFGAKKDMAKMNERGLELLKQSIEQ